jgi:predicted Ser/Thr protein kinase
VAEADDEFEALLKRVAKTPEAPVRRGELMSGSRLMDRFEIERKLGAGATGRVYAAYDLAKQTRVAVKLLGSVAPHSVGQLKREFRAAAELAHPNLVRLHELFCEGAESFFTMELVDGMPLPRLGRELGGLQHDLLRVLLRQLGQGLRELHRTGTLHGDLKPSNFLVTTPERRVVLLDFGLARPVGPPDSERRFAGTPEYMAPEQASGLTLTEAADWYSFGVVMYEALSGRLPSRSAALLDLARAPADLAQLCLDLLRRDPKVRPRADEVLRRLGDSYDGSVRLSSIPPGARIPLIGRDFELAALNGAYERTVAGEPALVLVHGPSGIGKTALVERFTQDAKSRGALLLAGRCHERESVGYKAADGLIDGILRWLDQMPERQARELIPDDIAELTRIFPALRAAAAVAHAPKRNEPATDQKVMKARAVGAFGRLLAAARRRGPVVIWIDDLQWSDRESAQLFEPLLIGPGRVPLLFIGSYRPSAVGRGALLDTLLATRDRGLPLKADLELSPLDEEEAETLALRLLPRAPSAEEIARGIARDAGGHPLFVAELAFFSAFTQANAGPDEAPSSKRIPATLSEMVAVRLAALPPEAQCLLYATAIAGAPVSRAVARRAVSLTPAEAERAMDLLRAHRLLKTDGVGDDDNVDVHHDRIRELVLHGMEDGQRRRYHLSLAEALQAQPASRAENLAAHFQAAGESALAGQHYIRAADEALGALAFARAAELFALGLGLASLSDAERRAVQVRQAQALSHAGFGVAAAEVYLVSARSGSREEALDLKRRAAEQLLLAGHLERGLEVVEEVLRTLGMRKTRGGGRALLSVALGRARVRARGLDYTSRSETEIPAEELARVDASWSVACSLGVIDFIRGADFQNEHVLLALDAGEPRRLLRALTLEIAYSATPGLGSERRTEALLALVDRLAEQVNDRAASALVLLGRGVAASLQGRTLPALTHCESALEVLATRSAGAIWETVTAQRFVIWSLFHLGRLRALSERVPPLVAEAEAQGNLYAATFFRTSFSNSAWLVNDRADEARKHIARAYRDWTAEGVQLAHSWMLIGEVLLEFYEGDTERACARVNEVWDKFHSAQIHRVGLVRTQLHYLRAASSLGSGAAALEKGQKARGKELLSVAARSIAKLERERLPLAPPLSLMMRGALDAASGRSKSACERLERAAVLLDEQGFWTAAVAARARIGEIQGDAASEVLVARALASLKAEGVKNPRRMLNLLAPGFVRR